jgi:hypothetical protein
MMDPRTAPAGEAPGTWLRLLQQKRYKTFQCGDS